MPKKPFNACAFMFLVLLKDKFGLTFESEILNKELLKALNEINDLKVSKTCYYKYVAMINENYQKAKFYLENLNVVDLLKKMYGLTK